MINETLAFTAIILLLGMVAVKFYSIFKLSNNEQLYPNAFILVGFFMAWLFWLMLFFSLGSELVAEETIVTGSQTITVSSNDYLSFSLMFSFGSLLASIVTIFTIIEGLFLLVIPFRLTGGFNQWQRR